MWVLNNDTEVDPLALSCLLERMHLEPRIGICGSTLLNFEQRERVQAFGGASYQAWRARSACVRRVHTV